MKLGDNKLTRRLLREELKRAEDLRKLLAEMTKLATDQTAAIADLKDRLFSAEAAATEAIGESKRLSREHELLKIDFDLDRDKSWPTRLYNDAIINAANERHKAMSELAKTRFPTALRLIDDAYNNRLSVSFESRAETMKRLEEAAQKKRDAIYLKDNGDGDAG